VLQTQWLDVPIGRNPDHAELTWGAFSETLDTCLQGITLHVARCVNDRARLESVVTELFVGNLDVLVSPLADREKLRCLRTAADLMLERRALPQPGRD